ncbi:hypothetical protein AB9P05_20745 [Roseivirga sp. BDSF3-8]|uniref:hypothetical protein n=1 Tax=Roseivirga sp. BDSF3-8 TaxID=3241598 RepID=UPI003531E66D
MSLKAKWITFSVAGLVLVGAGLSLLGDAILVKESATSLHEWFWYGTFALVTFNSGLCLFGQGVIYRVKMIRD